MNRLVSLQTKLNSRFLSHLIRPSKISKPTSRCTRLKTEKRYIQSCSKNYRMPKTPDLIYVPHVFRWVKSKLRFKYLKKIWDPEFSEGAFIYGSTKAVCRITEIISSGRLDELDNLMTVSAKIRLQDDINYRLSPDQKNLILLKPEDIKILIPITVILTKEGAGRMCRVNLRILGLKWHEVTSDNYKLVLVALQTEFSRDYSDDATPEWIISGFSILECAMLTEATATR